MKESLHIIKQEHRNLFRVVNVLDQILRGITPEKAPDFAFIESLLDYIANFTDTHHHPKEDQFLFKALLKRDPTASAIIDELEEEHALCPIALKTLQDAMVSCRDAYPQGLEAFKTAAQEYLRFQTKHLQKEEGVVLPMAQRALLEEDWAEIDAAFADNEDPVFGGKARAEARAMYSRIVHEAPAPFGFGD